MRTCSGIPCPCWCTHETLSCLLHNFQECLKLQLLLLNLHPRLLRGLVEITPPLTPVSIGTQRMLLTLNTSLASRLAGGAGGTELGRAALLQGAKKCPCSSFCECQQAAKAGWEGGAVLCMVPAAVVGEERHTRTSNQRESASTEQPGCPPAPARYTGTPTAPSPRQGPRASFGEQWDQNRGSRAEKLT